MRQQMLLTTALLMLSLNGSHLFASIINATITGGSALNDGGTFVYLTPPPLNNPFGAPNSVGNNNFQSNNLYAFDELTVTLSSPLTPDIGATIPSGAMVTSHFIFFDPRRAQSTIEATIEFNEEILGIMRRTSSMNATDALFGLPGINYLTPAGRGLEPSDTITVLGSRTISISWQGGDPGDHIRVLTRYIPEPVSIALCGLGVAAACLLSRVSRRRIR